MKTLGLVTALAVLLAGRAGAQQRVDADVARRWAGVAEWTGIWEADETFSWTSDVSASTWKRQHEERRSSGRFRLGRRLPEQGGTWDPQGGTFEWSGSGTEAHSVSTSLSDRDMGNGPDLALSASGKREASDVRFTALVGEGRARFGPGAVDRNLPAREVGTVLQGDQSRSVDRLTSATGLGPIAYKILQGQLPLPGTPGVITFHDELSKETSDGPSRSARTYRSRLVLFPAYDDVECEVTIAGYDAWRPRGSIEDPRQPGGALVARATLRSKVGKPLPPVDRFRFELVGTSREPGVCLNWPLGAKEREQDPDYDLRLADFATGSPAGDAAALKKFLSEWDLSSAGDRDLGSLPPGGVPRLSFAVVSEDGQKGELPDPPKDAAGSPFAEVAIESWDFGGKAALFVVCVLQDGREVMGLMKQAGGATDLVHLPRRRAGDWIAAAWREKWNVPDLAELADDERVEGQPLHGDGFTAYEEYRGWAVGGKHYEGDPRAKDFFLLNLIGADARPGIRIFQSLSRLRVCAGLRRSEMSESARLMNGNHTSGPHREAQHGVWLRTFPTSAALGDEGAQTVMLEKGVVGRPGKVKGIGILPRGHAESVFEKPWNLPAREAFFAWDRAIAHELLHSVGVEHHGKGDVYEALGFFSTRHPRNTLGRPFFGRSPTEPVDVRTEDGQDLAAVYQTELYPRERATADIALRERLLQEGREFIARNGPQVVVGDRSPEEWADFRIEQLVICAILNVRGIVGVPQGSSSGDQDCVMRYYFASFYRPGPPGTTLYRIPPGSEHIGLDICHAKTGTGINAASHRPRPRYGDAADGDCFAQICPNDAIPPRRLP